MQRTAGDPLNQFMITEQLLGEGSSAKVYLGVHKSSKSYAAIKIISKSKLQKVEEISRITREIELMKVLVHPNIISMYEAAFIDGSFYIALEFAPYNLLKQVEEHGSIGEPLLCHYVLQIMNGLQCIHEHGIIHRDLKLENILLIESNIKLADFGLSNALRLHQEKLITRCGSPEYVAPEIFQGFEYGREVDIWSLGVVIYVCLTCTFPFGMYHQSGSPEEFARKVIKAKIDYPKDHMSEAVRMFLKKIFVASPKKRITIKGMREMKWLINEPKK